MKKKNFSYLFTFILIVITIIIILSSIEIYSLSEVLGLTNNFYILLAVLSMIGVWLTDALIIKEISHIVSLKLSFIKSLKIAMIGQYYIAVTPFAIGCQPAQIHCMVRDSNPVGKASSIIINKFIIFHLVLTLYSMIIYVFNLRFIYRISGNLFPFITISIILHVIMSAAIVGLFFNSELLKKMIFIIISAVHRIGIIKDIEEWKTKSVEHLQEYKINIDTIKHNWRMSTGAAVLTFLQLTLFFSITYFIYLSLRYNTASYMDILTIQSILYVAASILPAPGMIGVSEGGFYILFKRFFSHDMLIYAILLWRIITYYMNLVVCGPVAFIDYLFVKKNSKT